MNHLADMELACWVTPLRYQNNRYPQSCMGYLVRLEPHGSAVHRVMYNYQKVSLEYAAQIVAVRG